MQTIIRHGDTMIAVKTTPATIDFADILAATEVVADENSDAPWEQWDGLEHTAKQSRHLPDANATLMQGYALAHGRQQLVIQLPAGDIYGIVKHARATASRQVAAELSAAEKRRTLAQLVDWYENGWQWYRVKCNFSILSESYSDSVWGIDSKESAEEMREEIAGQVASQLEEVGFTVTGEPVATGPTRQNKADRLSRNLASQNWNDK